MYVHKLFIIQFAYMYKYNVVIIYLLLLIV